MSERKPGDEQLLRAIEGGDEAAFVALYRRWQAPLFRFALQMSGSRVIAEDVTQEVFMAVIRGSRGFSLARGSLGAWLYGIARHMVIKALEREKAPVAVSLDDDGEAPVDNLRAPGGDPYQQLVRNQRTERLRNAVLALPVHYREVLVLCELHEMDYAEAAKSLGCSIGTVRSRLHRARSMLTERLRPAGLEAVKNRSFAAAEAANSAVPAAGKSGAPRITPDVSAI